MQQKYLWGSAALIVFGAAATFLAIDYTLNNPSSILVRYGVAASFSGLNFNPLSDVGRILNGDQSSSPAKSQIIEARIVHPKKKTAPTVPAPLGEETIEPIQIDIFASSQPPVDPPSGTEESEWRGQWRPATGNGNDPPKPPRVVESVTDFVIPIEITNQQSTSGDETANDAKAAETNSILEIIRALHGFRWIINCKPDGIEESFSLEGGCLIWSDLFDPETEVAPEQGVSISRPAKSFDFNGGCLDRSYLFDTETEVTPPKPATQDDGKKCEGGCQGGCCHGCGHRLDVAVVQIRNVQFVKNNSDTSPACACCAQLGTWQRSLISELEESNEPLSQRVQSVAAKLEDHYKRKGYFNVKVTHEVQFTDDERFVDVTFHICEGLRYHIMDVNITTTGFGEIPQDQVMSFLTLHNGDMYNERSVDQDIRNITDLYGWRGYPSAVEKKLEFADPTADPGAVRVKYHITVQKPHRVGHIVITGSAVTERCENIREGGCCHDCRQCRERKSCEQNSELLQVQRENLPQIQGEWRKHAMCDESSRLTPDRVDGGIAPRTPPMDQNNSQSEILTAQGSADRLESSTGSLAIQNGYIFWRGGDIVIQALSVSVDASAEEIIFAGTAEDPVTVWERFDDHSEITRARQVVLNRGTNEIENVDRLDANSDCVDGGPVPMPQTNLQLPTMIQATGGFYFAGEFMFWTQKKQPVSICSVSFAKPEPRDLTEVDDLRQVLQRKITLNFENAPLWRCLACINDYIGRAHIVIGPRGPNAVGKSLEQPLTIRLTNVELKNALEQLLDPVGLTYWTVNEDIRIGPPECAPKIDSN